MRVTIVLLALSWCLTEEARSEDAIREGIVPVRYGRYVTTGASINHPGKLDTLTLAYQVEGKGRRPRAQVYIRWDADPRPIIRGLTRGINYDKRGHFGYWQSSRKKVEVSIQVQYGAELRDFDTLARDIVRRIEDRAGPWPVLFTRVSFPESTGPYLLGHAFTEDRQDQQHELRLDYRLPDMRGFEILAHWQGGPRPTDAKQSPIRPYFDPHIVAHYQKEKEQKHVDMVRSETQRARVLLRGSRRSDEAGGDYRFVDGEEHQRALRIARSVLAQITDWAIERGAPVPPSRPADLKPPRVTGVVKDVQGRVTIERKGWTPWYADVGDEIRLEDRIVTGGAPARVTIEFFDADTGALLDTGILGPVTEAVIALPGTIPATAGSPTPAASTVIDLKEGDIDWRRKPGGGTPAVTILGNVIGEVRGTRVLFHRRGVEGLVLVEHGAVFVKAPNTGRSATLGANQKISVDTDGRIATVRDLAPGEFSEATRFSGADAPRGPWIRHETRRGVSLDAPPYWRKIDRPGLLQLVPTETEDVRTSVFITELTLGKDETLADKIQSVQEKTNAVGPGVTMDPVVWTWLVGRHAALLSVRRSIDGVRTQILGYLLRYGDTILLIQAQCPEREFAVRQDEFLAIFSSLRLKDPPR